jgi:siderophore synthetase component
MTANAVTPGPVADPDRSADEIAAHTLLNCLVREVAGPAGQLCRSGGYAVIRLPRFGLRLRVRIRRTALLGPDRFTGPVEEAVEEPGGEVSAEVGPAVGAAVGTAGWRRIGCVRLAGHIQRELTAVTGLANEEFAAQVRASRDLVAAALRARAAQHAHPVREHPNREHRDREHPDREYVASEQALAYGHRFHPMPKARTGPLAEALRYAPEVGARFPLHFLAVHPAVLREEYADPSAAATFDKLGGPAVPSGYARLPVHPWQYALLRDHPALRAALADGRLLDLGTGGPPVLPTASVRTIWHPDTGGFCKFSLNVRITNCVRRNAEYELTGAVALTRLLRPVAADLAACCPGTVLLPEPGYRTVDLGPEPGGTELLEGLGVIVRDPLTPEPGVTPLLAAALADEYGGTLDAVLGRGAGTAAAALAWWEEYVGLLVPPVLCGYLRHGVVFEPHQQNVVVGVGPDGAPRQVFLRDLEGVKLLPERHRDGLAGLPERVRAQVCYDPARGWQRVAYCLLVNHLAELLAALADRYPRLEAVGWRRVRAHLVDAGRRFGGSPELAALLAGAPLPAKANLLTRWARQADRRAGYVPLASPLGTAR